MDKVPELFTQENIVYAQGIQIADITKPVQVYKDTAGHHALVDGNHRSYKANILGQLDQLPRDIIGYVAKDISQDSNFRPIDQLKVIYT